MSAPRSGTSLQGGMQWRTNNREMPCTLCMHTYILSVVLSMPFLGHSSFCLFVLQYNSSTIAMRRRFYFLFWKAVTGLHNHSLRSSPNYCVRPQHCSCFVAVLVWVLWIGFRLRSRCPNDNETLRPPTLTLKTNRICRRLCTGCSPT